jgi:hypothetical protein
MHPTLLNACASAATAAEARFRIDRPIPGRSACVVALDEGAAAVVRRLAEQPWSGARFVRAAGGPESPLPDELEDADLVVLIATSDDGADVAAAIARACDRRRIMTAGLILADALEARAAVAALRPYAPVLLVSDDEGDVSEVLTALRA